MARSSTSWQSGQTGNPGGRPKAIAEVRELAQQYTKKAILRLVDILDSDKSMDAAVVSAAGAILDRAVGRPEQSITQETTLRNASPEEYMPDLDEMRRIMKGQKVEHSPARAAIDEAVDEPEDPSVH